MRRNQIIFLILMLVSWTGVTAQDKLVLNLEEAKEYAVKYNKTLKNSGLSIQQSQEAIWEAISAGLPQVNATTDYTNSMGAVISIQFQEGVDPTEIPIKPTSNFNLQVGQLIFSGNYIVGVQTAKMYKKLSEKNFDKTELDIISQVIENYYLVLISEESLKILNENVKNLEAIYSKTEPMVEVGMMEKVELDQLSVQVNSLKNSVKSAERQYEMAKNMFRLQLGISADTELELADKLADLFEESDVKSSLNSTFEIGNNINYQLMNVQENLTEKAIDMQKANYLPTISGYYSYTYKILKPSFDMSPTNVVGVQMNIPVFSGGERRSKLRQARIDLETVQNNKELLEDQLAIQYKQLAYNLQSALEAYENQSESVKVSRDVYESYKEKYEQGVISGLELTTADNNYLKAESDYLTAKLNVLQAQNELNTLLGEIK